MQDSDLSFWSSRSISSTTSTELAPRDDGFAVFVHGEPKTSSRSAEEVRNGGKTKPLLDRKGKGLKIHLI